MSDKDKIYAFYISFPSGECIFSIDFSPMPPSALITAMLSAMQSFIFEVSGARARKLSTAGFVFHMENLEKINLVIASSSETPPKQMTELRSAFLHKYGGKLSSWRGDTSLFANFEEDVKRILNFDSLLQRIPPKKKLNAYSLLQIRPDLQPVARELALNKETTVQQLREKLDQSLLVTKIQLEELYDLGFVGKHFNNGEFTYFL